jgi:hypothetical protein
MLPLGHNRVGQLGIMNIIGFPVNNEGAYYVPTPLRVHDLPQGVKFQQVLCVCVYAVCLCMSGVCLYVTITFSNVFTCVCVCVQVSAGWGHSALITEDGAVYTCGRNVHGQLGLGPPSNFPLNERGHPYLVRSSCVFVYICVRFFTHATFLMERTGDVYKSHRAADSKMPQGCVWRRTLRILV